MSSDDEAESSSGALLAVAVARAHGVVTVSDDSAGDEPYVLVEEIAERLGLPLTVLLRRIEAGDIPARRIETVDGVRYGLRLGDLGIELDDDGMRASAMEGDQATPGTLPAPLQSGIVFQAEAPERRPARRREPQQPPPWIIHAEVPADHGEGDQPLEVEIGIDQDAALAALAVPPPGRTPFDRRDGDGPRADLASMSLDARELVAGLLDRWEHTLEQRIYTEQRQRFQAELATGQGMVNDLQMELLAVRAEHAAAQAATDRELAGKERELADRERELADARRRAEDAQSLLPAARRPRRGWLRHRHSPRP